MNLVAFKNIMTISPCFFLLRMLYIIVLSILVIVPLFSDIF